MITSTLSPAGTHRPGPLSALIIGLARHTPMGRGALRKQMARAVRALNDGPLDVPLYGGKARLYPLNNNCEIKALLSPGRFSREEYAFCRQHMPQEDGVFVDVGANVGLFSLYVASLMRSGVLIAAEPQPEMHARMVANFELMNPHLGQRLDLHLVQTALGAETGSLELSLTQSPGQASARPLAGARRMQVAMMPMLSLVRQAGATRLDVLKIDIEGFEDGVLFPYFETAPQTLWPRAIVMERCHARRWERDCEAMLLGNDYKIVSKDRTNMMLVRDAH